MRRIALALLLSATPFVQGCFTSLGFCCGRATDMDEVTRSDRREVKKEIAKEARDEREEKADEFGDDAEKLREKDFAAYLRFVTERLELPKIWTANRTRPGFVRAVRVQAFDGLAGPGGLRVSARVEEVPDWAYVVDAAAKAAFGDQASRRLDARISRDLWLSERWAARHFELGIAGTEVVFRVEGTGVNAKSAARHTLGRARTDGAGRATLSLPPGSLPAAVTAGAWALIAEAAEETTRPLEPEPRGRLLVRGSAAPARALVVDADALLEWLDRDTLRGTLLEKEYRVRDYCVKDALAALTAKGYRIVVISPQPDRLAAPLREAIAKHGVVPEAAQVVFAPRDGTPSAAEATDFDADALAAQKEYWGEITGFVGRDPAIEGAAAARAKVPFLQLAPARGGGWCAGIPPLIPSR